MYIYDRLSEARYLRTLDFLLYSLFLYCVRFIVFLHCALHCIFFSLSATDFK